MLHARRDTLARMAPTASPGSRTTYPIAFLLLLLPTLVCAEVHRNPGTTTPAPHEKYVRVVSETDSPVQQT
jgi:hypothetical protein